MSSYILSNANRFYVALEAAYGQPASVTAANRYPAVLLAAQQALEPSRRRDKTGSRTFLGTPATARRSTAFETQTYLTSWSGMDAPSYGPFFQSALGAVPVVSSGLTVRQVSNPTLFQTTVPHSLKPGTAVSVNHEIRFTNAVPDSLTLSLNAPFTGNLIPGTVLAPAITYSLATTLPSLTLYDYWDPVTAIQRIVTGAAVDSLDLSLNGDLHEFRFRGPAADIVDSGTFVSGAGGLSEFPAEPALGTFDYSIVPGHLGQAWIGNSATQLFTLTAAQIQLRNHLETRHREFGATIPRAVSAGMRQVATHFSVLAQDDSQSATLYAASRSRTPLPAMLQLGQSQGQLMGIYLPNVMPEFPHYNDNESRLQWEFRNCQAQGQSDDELFIAFA
jgi:hypothetical protein